MRTQSTNLVISEMQLQMATDIEGRQSQCKSGSLFQNLSVPDVSDDLTS